LAFSFGGFTQNTNPTIALQVVQVQEKSAGGAGARKICRWCRCKKNLQVAIDYTVMKGYYEIDLNA
jgi:hypothetical protein